MVGVEVHDCCYKNKLSLLYISVLYRVFLPAQYWPVVFERVLAALMKETAETIECPSEIELKSLKSEIRTKVKSLVSFFNI